MLKDLHSDREKDQEVMCSQEMLGEIDITNSMDFYPNYTADIKMGFEDDNENQLPFFRDSEDVQMSESPCSSEEESA